MPSPMAPMEMMVIFAIVEVDYGAVVGYGFDGVVLFCCSSWDNLQMWGIAVDHSSSWMYHR